MDDLELTIFENDDSGALPEAFFDVMNALIQHVSGLRWGLIGLEGESDVELEESPPWVRWLQEGPERGPLPQIRIEELVDWSSHIRWMTDLELVAVQEGESLPGPSEAWDPTRLAAEVLYHGTWLVRMRDKRLLAAVAHDCSAWRQELG